MHFDKNFVKLTGEIVSDITVAYEHQGIKFVNFYLASKRLSETKDVLLVVAKSAVIPEGVGKGSRVSLTGDYRVYQNRFSNITSRNAYVVYTTDIELDATGVDVNEIDIIGYPVSVKPVRSTATGRSLREVVIATNKYFTKADGSSRSKSYYINCIAWSNAISFFEDTDPSELIEVKGRIQSRPFKKAGDDAEHVAYEVSISTVNDFVPDNSEDDTSEGVNDN